MLIRVMLCFLGKVEGVSRGIAVVFFFVFLPEEVIYVGRKGVNYYIVYSFFLDFP